MYCRVCGKQINDQADICTGYGCNPRKGKKFCQNCGAVTSDNQEMCTSCGVRLVSLNDVSSNSKQKLTAALLAFFLGAFGVHDFYLGYKKNGIIKLILTITFIGSFISEVWALIDFVMILTDGKPDANGQKLI